MKVAEDSQEEVTELLTSFTIVMHLEVLNSTQSDGNKIERLRDEIVNEGFNGLNGVLDESTNNGLNKVQNTSLDDAAGSRELRGDLDEDKEFIDGLSVVSSSDVGIQGIHNFLDLSVVFSTFSKGKIVVKNVKSFIGTQEDFSLVRIELVGQVNDGLFNGLDGMNQEFNQMLSSFVIVVELDVFHNRISGQKSEDSAVNLGGLSLVKGSFKGIQESVRSILADFKNFFQTSDLLQMRELRQLQDALSELGVVFDVEGRINTTNESDGVQCRAGKAEDNDGEEDREFEIGRAHV